MRVNKKNILVVGLMFSALPIFANAADTNLKERNIITTGHAQVFIPETVATTQLAINENGKNADDIQKSVRVKADKLVKTLKAAQLATSIETLSFSINPQWSYQNNVAKLDGYSANYSLQVKSSLTEAGKIIDLAMDNGVTSVNGPSLSASDKEKSAAELEAIKLATLDAKKQAEASLSALGLHSTTVKQITVVNAGSHNQLQPRYTAMSMAKLDNQSATTTPIEGGKEAISAEVSLTTGY
jgi:uncharacterized protein YggE